MVSSPAALSKVTKGSAAARPASGSRMNTRSSRAICPVMVLSFRDMRQRRGERRHGAAERTGAVRQPVKGKS